MKRLSAALLLTAGLLTVSSAAYGQYCEDISARAAAGEYSGQLREISTQFVHALEQQDSTSEAEGADIPGLYSGRLEIFGKFADSVSSQEYSLECSLIDYDLLLKKLELYTDRYSALKATSEEKARMYLVGECTRQESEKAEKQRSDMYYEIQSLLFEISSLKSSIEEITGETLRSDFDFDSLYLITDALKLVPEELSVWGVSGSVCAADGAEFPEAEQDVTTEYNAAVKAYYSLGEALRTYVDAAGNYDRIADEFRCGAATESQLKSSRTAFEDARYEALVRKGEYAKTLMVLDEVSGGKLSGCTVGSGLTAALSESLPEELRGKGTWLVRRNGDEVRLYVVRLPFDYDPEKDSVEVQVRYSGVPLYSGILGGSLDFRSPAVVHGDSHAVVEFRKNGKSVGSYAIDIYSPFGEFLEGQND